MYLQVRVLCHRVMRGVTVVMRLTTISFLGRRHMCVDQGAVHPPVRRDFVCGPGGRGRRVSCRVCARPLHVEAFASRESATRCPRVRVGVCGRARRDGEAARRDRRDVELTCAGVVTLLTVVSCWNRKYH